MPFNHPFPRSFTASSVRQFAPTLSGIYGLSNASSWIYIGETDNIQEALSLHLRQPDATPLSQQPTGFVFEICDSAKRSGRQDCLILEYEPTSNQQRSLHR